MSLIIVVAMLRVGKRMGRCCRSISGSNENNLRMGNPTTKVVYPIVGGEHEDEKTNQRTLEGNIGSTCSV
jgi:hypothetical protein